MKWSSDEIMIEGCRDSFLHASTSSTLSDRCGHQVTVQKRSCKPLHQELYWRHGGSFICGKLSDDAPGIFFKFVDAFTSRTALCLQKPASSSSTQPTVIPHTIWHFKDASSRSPTSPMGSLLRSAEDLVLQHQENLFAPIYQQL